MTVEQMYAVITSITGNFSVDFTRTGYEISFGSASDCDAVATGLIRGSASVQKASSTILLVQL